MNIPSNCDPNSDALALTLSLEELHVLAEYHERRYVFYVFKMVELRSQGSFLISFARESRNRLIQISPEILAEADREIELNLPEWEVMGDYYQNKLEKKCGFEDTELEWDAFVEYCSNWNTNQANCPQAELGPETEEIQGGADGPANWWKLDRPFRGYRANDADKWWNSI